MLIVFCVKSNEIDCTSLNPTYSEAFLGTNFIYQVFAGRNFVEIV